MPIYKHQNIWRLLIGVKISLNSHSIFFSSVNSQWACYQLNVRQVYEFSWIISTEEAHHHKHHTFFFYTGAILYCIFLLFAFPAFHSFLGRTSNKNAPFKTHFTWDQYLEINWLQRLRTEVEIIKSTQWTFRRNSFSFASCTI